MEDRQEYVNEQLLLRTETLDEIAKGAEISRRVIGYIIKGRDMNVRTLNKLYNYFKSKEAK